jgi:hypothetical protein
VCKWTCAQGDRRRVWPGSIIVEIGKEITVLGTLIIVLVVLWLLGLVTSYTLGGFIHILLVVAIIIILVRIIQGRNPLQG